MRKFIPCFFISFLLVTSLNVVAQTSTISGIINTYTKVTAIDVCAENITLTSAAGYNVGDTVLIIQMKGAIVDTSATSSFGNIVSYNNAGNYEFGSISKIAGNVVSLKYKLLKGYDPSGLVQLIRVPYYNNATVTGTLNAQPWNGNTGGVLVFLAAGTVTLNANIDVTDAGFKGGSASLEDSPPEKTSPSYFYPSSSALAGQKGEGIAALSSFMTVGRGAAANGGGGSNEWNNGGAGGGNYGTGGLGGLRNPAYPVAYGGNLLTYSTVLNKIFLGGGGGGGHQDNSVGTNGTNGGGIVIIGANTVTGNGNMIKANANTPPTNAAGDGAGAGGAGGTILLNASGFTTTLVIQANGGNGGNVAAINYGAGGGGSGGVIWTNAALPGSVTTSVTGGSGGIWTPDGTVNGQAGQLGGLLTGLQFPQSNIVAGNGSAGPNQFVCQGAVAPITATGGVSYSWTPAAYLSATTGANVTASPTATGAYNYSVTITDASGCYSYAGVMVTVVNSLTANAGSDVTVCSGNNATLIGSGGQTYTWSPSTGLINPTNYTTTFTLTAPGVYNYTLTASSGSCSPSADAVMITVNPAPVPTLSGYSNATVCSGSSVPINVSGATNFSWSPAGGLNAVTGSSVVANPSVTTVYTLTGINGNSGCPKISSVSITISVNSLPTVSVAPSSISICAGSTTTLSALCSSASQPVNYLWQPSTGLSSSVTQQVSAGPAASTSYTVTATDTNGCFRTAQGKININALPVITVSSDQTICNGASATLSAGGGNSYNWSPATSPSNAPIVKASPANPTTYTVTGTDQNGCSGTAMVKITTSPVVVTSQNATITQGQSVTLSVVTNGTHYNWTPGATLSCNTCSAATASPPATTLYQVTVTDDNGCSRMDTIVVTVLENRCGGDVFVPNAFSPNNDGQNEILYLKTLNSNCIQTMLFEIYDRWGTRVFESTNVANGWDGKMQGKENNTAVFVYRLQVTFTDKTTINKKGNITLIK